MSRPGLGLIVILVAACSGSPAPAGSPAVTAAASPSTQPTPAAPATASPTPIAVASAPSPPETDAPGTGKFTVCPAAKSGQTCPLAPGKYTAAVHDQFSFSIPDAGWQEERAVAGEFDTRVILTRIEDPAQRLTFLSGETTAASPATVDPAAFAIQGFKAGQPTDVKIGGTDAQYIDLEPAGAPGASAVRIENQVIRIEPDRRYRFTVAKIPMMEEAATFIVVTEAPLDRFDTFLTTADQLLGTVGFS